jgi:hypothetical protein
VSTRDVLRTLEKATECFQFANIRHDNNIVIMVLAQRATVKSFTLCRALICMEQSSFSPQIEFTALQRVSPEGSAT